MTRRLLLFVFWLAPLAADLGAPPLSPTQYLDRGDGRIAFAVTGTGPLVLCVPGMGEIRSSFRHVVPAAARAGFTVATMDLRGHGDSDPTFDSFDDDAAATDVAALVEHMAASKALLGPFVRNPPANPVTKAIVRVLMDGPWAAAAWLAYLPSFYASGKPADFAEYLDVLRASFRRPGYRKAFTFTTQTSPAPAERRLAGVDAPTLVILGNKDPDFKDAAAEAARIAQTLRGEAVVLDGIGHYPQAEADLHDWEALSLTAASQRLGVKTPSLYKHIDSLAALRTAVATAAIESLADSLGEAVMGRSGSESLAALSTAYRRRAHAYPGQYAATLAAPSGGDGALHGFVAIEAAGGLGMPQGVDESFSLLVAELDSLLRGRAA